MENNLFGCQGQYLFWEPMNKDIPETGYSLDIPFYFPLKDATKTNSSDPKYGTE
jgi:hypothetical protein